jgi:hypothetical protein
MARKKEPIFESVCEDCGGLISLEPTTALVSELLEQLLAGEQLSAEKLTLLASHPTTTLCQCLEIRSNVLNWPKLHQLVAILIPD